MLKHARRFLTHFLVVTFVGLTLTGCGGGAEDDKWTADRPKTFPVQGKVLYNGNPLEGAMVSFQSPGTGKDVKGASGITNSAGEFQLMTFSPGDGAIVGNHKVTVTKSVTEGGDPSYFDEKSPNYGKEPPPEAIAKTKHLIPEKYSKFDTSGLTAEVKEGDSNPVTIELKD